MALRQLLGIRHGIELHVAKHPADLHAQLQLLGEQFAKRLEEELPQLADRAQQLQRSTDPTEQIAYLQDLREQFVRARSPVQAMAHCYCGFDSL